MTYSDDGRAVFLLEFTEAAAIDYACDDISHVESLSEVGSDNTMEFGSRI